jgi:2-polyprenyl-6-methoxyphenol hydroxylase-like FAD-dependent oxidoreductase
MSANFQSDACHVCHPLAGLGVNIGFGDVIAIRDTIKSAIYSGVDIGIN